MSPSALIVMLTSITSVIALVAFCLYRVLRLPPVEDDDLKDPLMIETGDLADAD